MIPANIRFQKPIWVPLRMSIHQDLTDYYANAGAGQKVKSIKISQVNASEFKRKWCAELETMTINNWFPGMKVEFSGTTNFNSSFSIVEVDEAEHKIYFTSHIQTAHVQAIEEVGYAKPSGTNIEAFIDGKPVLNHNRQILYYEYDTSGTYYLWDKLTDHQDMAIQVVNCDDNNSITLSLKCSINGIDWTEFPNNINDRLIDHNSNEVFVIAEHMRGYYIKIIVDNPNNAKLYAISSI